MRILRRSRPGSDWIRRVSDAGYNNVVLTKRQIVIASLYAVFLLLLSSPTFARGGLGAFTDLAGAWSGPGTDESGATHVNATIDAVFGRHLMLHATAGSREDLAIFAADGEALRAFCYDSTGAMHACTGALDLAGQALSGADGTFAVSLARSGDGLVLTRSRLDGGALHEVARFTLLRTPAGDIVERRRAVDENLDFFRGEHTGTGKSTQETHFDVTDSCQPQLADHIVVARQKETHSGGRVAEFLIVHGLAGEQPFRHQFADDGTVTAFTGQVTDVGQLKFFTPQGDANLMLLCGKT